MDPLVERLSFPRETSLELNAARVVLDAAFRDAGVAPRAQEFTSHPGRSEAAGFLCLAAGLALSLSLVRGSRARACATFAGLFVAFAIAMQAGMFDRLIGSRREANLCVTIDPRGDVASEVALSAHYDSKTEWLDHVERGALFGTTFVIGLGLGMAALLRRRRAVRVLAAVLALGLGLCGAQQVSPLGVGERSLGAADDAASCALLVELARDLAAWPLERTRVRIVLFAAEEIGAQGSRAWMAQLEGRPEVALNLECLGAGPRVGIALCEWTGAGLAQLPQGLDRSLQGASERALVRVGWPVVTDAGSWRRAGVPAATLVGLPAKGWGPRGLHSRRDAPAALDREGLDVARQLLERWLMTWDAKPLP